jgi:hypothetical protein
MKQDVTKIIGYILLTPAIISVLMFLLQLIKKSKVEFFQKFMYTPWTGSVDYYMKYDGGGGGGGYSSALPLYFGLMAIAGAYLIKESKN